MNVGKTIAGALAGAVIGCAVWAGVAWLTGYELGILAIGLGLTCGIGAAMGAQGRAGTSGGIIAAVTAMVAIVVARGFIVEMSINQMVSEALAENSQEVPGPEDDEYWVSFIADQIIEREGGATDWADSDDESESVASMYPPEVWSKAQSRWNSMSPADKQEFCTAGAGLVAQQTAEGIESFKTVAGVIGMLWTNLHPMALFIMGLAMFTAFRTARNAQPVDAGGESGTTDVMTMPIDSPHMSMPQTPPTQTPAPSKSAMTSGQPVAPLVRPPAQKPTTPTATQESSETWLPPWMRK